MRQNKYIYNFVHIAVMLVPNALVTYKTERMIDESYAIIEMKTFIVITKYIEFPNAENISYISFVKINMIMSKYLRIKKHS